MQYTLQELLWFMLIYSFAGWVLETAAGSIKSKKFVNRGFSAGPFCLAYGVAAVLLAVFTIDLTGHPFWLFVGCTIIGTAVEWFAGKLLERFNQHKWWDYSDKKWNFDGYICLQYSLLWGALGVLGIKFGNPIILTVVHLIPQLLQVIILLVVSIVLLLDVLMSLLAALQIKRGFAAAEKLQHKVDRFTRRFGKWIIRVTRNRMEKAYPVLKEANRQLHSKEIFASGCGFYKLFWLFFIGAFLGDITETIFCRFTMGRWMSRSSLVWGPFSLVWGIGIAGATALLYKDRHKPDRHLFVTGMLLGGTFEYICSVFTEVVFGKVFWDYSKIPFNIAGRVNLLYCFFWGIVAVIWIKLLYPRVSWLIEKIPRLIGIILTWILVAFMVADVGVSTLALLRYDARANAVEAEYGWEEWLDEHFNDAQMERIYPNAIDRSKKNGV